MAERIQWSSHAAFTVFHPLQFNANLGHVQQECLDIISVDQTIFRGEASSLRDATPRILKRIVALPKLPVSEEGLFLFLIKWKEYHRLDKDDPDLIKILKLVRFPCMRGQFLADVVQPTGLVMMDTLAEYPCTPREVSGWPIAAALARCKYVTTRDD